MWIVVGACVLGYFVYHLLHCTAGGVYCPNCAIPQLWYCSFRLNIIWCVIFGVIWRFNDYFNFIVVYRHPFILQKSEYYLMNILCNTKNYLFKNKSFIPQSHVEIILTYNVRHMQLTATRKVAHTMPTDLNVGYQFVEYFFCNLIHYYIKISTAYCLHIFGKIVYLIW